MKMTPHFHNQCHLKQWSQMTHKVTVQITEQLSRQFENTVKHLRHSVLQKEWCLCRVWMNMHQYPWRSLNILENNWIMFLLSQGSENVWYYVQQGFEDALGSKYTRVLHRVLNLYMAQYASTMPEYGWIYLDVPQYAWTWLNIDECPCICLQMPE